MSVMPQRTPMPWTSPALGNVSLVRMLGGEANLMRESTVSGSSEAPEARGRTLPSATKATRPRRSSCARAAAWSSTESRCVLITDGSNEEYNSAARASRGRMSARIDAAHRPIMVRPCAGRATVKRSSIASGVTTTADRSRTNCPGPSIVSSPPLPPCQPPASVRWSAPASLASRAKRRAIRSRRAISRGFGVKHVSGKPAAWRGIVR
eukprot:scaffold222139_cov30-Tisochrysis_lutea.AAC.4